jgi:hypothetical protein
MILVLLAAIALIFAGIPAMGAITALLFLDKDPTVDA